MGRINIRIFRRLGLQTTLFLIIALFSLVNLNSCSTERAVLEQRKTFPIGKGVSIYIEKPILSYMKMEDESPLDPAEYNGKEVSRTLLELSKEIMIEKSYKVLSDSALKNALTLHLKLSVYIGPGASWIPLSGKIKSGMTRTVISGNITNTDNKEYIWANRVQIREVPDPESEKFREAIHLLFSNLNE